MNYISYFLLEIYSVISTLIVHTESCNIHPILAYQGSPKSGTPGFPKDTFTRRKAYNLASNEFTQIKVEEHLSCIRWSV